VGYVEEFPVTASRGVTKSQMGSPKVRRQGTAQPVQEA